MTQFLLLAGVLLAAAYAFFLPTLLSRRPPSSGEREHLQILMYKQRRRELKQELAQGSLEPAEYDKLSQELDLQMLDESTAPAPGAKNTATVARWPVLFVLLALPFLGYGLYASLGRPDMVSIGGGEGSMPNAQAIEKSIKLLAQRLEQDSGNLQGWLLLARSQQTTKHPQEAAISYQRALALAPGNLDIKALYAQALAESQNNSLAGRPAEIVAEILAADPNHPTGLWLAGLAAAKAGDAVTAISHWQKLKAQYPPGSEDAKQLDAYLAMLQGGEPEAESHGVSVKVHVTLAPALAKAANPEDTLFVFAKAAQGPPMPLAIVRKRVKDLPADVTLDDSMAMAPGMKLSGFPKIVLGARVSKTGNAMPAPGDLQGTSEPVMPSSGTLYSIEISQVLP